MFERYTEEARRVIFFARFAASMDGAYSIGPFHLLAGIYKEKSELFNSLLLAKANLDFEKLFRGGKPRVPTSVEIPLSKGSEKALRLAVQSADRARSRSVAVEDLLCGVFQADARSRKQLKRAGLTEAALKRAAAAKPSEPVPTESAAEHLAHVLRVHSSQCGVGYDLHRLGEGRKLILGGVEVPFEKGPVGHSNGDVLSHAVCDALLGAAGLGDIGTHFPDTDPKWKGASSLLFLEHTRKLLDGRSLRIAHIDAVVITEKPRLGPHFPAMREALAKALGISPERVNLKAKTNEGVDAIGRGEAIASHAIATLEA